MRELARHVSTWRNTKPGRRTPVAPTPVPRSAAVAAATAFALMSLAAGPAHAQQEVVAGVVLAEHSLRPLAGARVAVAGAAGVEREVLTDANGRFRVDGLTGTQAQIRASFIGFRAATLTVPVGVTDVRILLTESAVSLDQVIVTGTAGGEQRRAIGNSIATVKAVDVVPTAPVRSIDDLLNGRAAGVVVLPGTGMSGSGAKVRIRGLSTFSLSSDPLIYVDGVRVNNETNSGRSVQFSSGVVSRLNDFDPEQIESIEILKGPAAATLYGTEASRGVINIITKRGAAGGTRFSFGVKQGTSTFANAEERMPVNYWRDPSGQVQSLNIVRRRNEQGRPIFRTGHLQSYSADVSGGTETVRYFMGGSLDRDEGAEPNNHSKRFSGRVNVDIAPSPDLDLGVSAGYLNSATSLSCEGGCGGAMFASVFSTPELLPENLCSPVPGYGCDLYEGFRPWTPEAYRMMELGQDVGRFTGSIRMEYRPFEWLSGRFTVGTDVTQEQNEEFLPYLTNDSVAFFWGPATGKGYKYQNRREQTFNTYDFSGTARFQVSPSVSSATSLGVQYYTRNIEYIGVQGNEFAGPGLRTVGAAAIKPYADDDYVDNNTLGLFLQETVGWRDRLFVTAALRVDNNSAFGSEVDFVTYPKASLSWVLTEEPLLERLAPQALNTLKLRAAYGESGTQPATFAALRTFAPVTGPGSTPAITPLSVGNPDLRPERGREIEVGFDAGLLDDRLGIDFTYYRKRTTDGVLLRPTPPSEGFAGSRWINAGEILNSGVEALLRASVLTGPRLGWDVSLNLATNRGSVEGLVGEDSAIVSGSTQYRIGYAPASWFRERVVSAAYDAATDRVTDIMCDNGDGGTMPCYDEAGGLVAPRVHLGRTIPSFEGSVASSITISQQFVLGAMVDFKHGYRKFNNNNQARCVEFRTCIENVHPEQADPVLLAQIRSGGRLQSSFFEDASFARLRELSLTWNVPARYAPRLFGARTAAVSVAARNLHTWTDYSGLDPEASYVFGGVTEQSMMPQLRQLVASINVSF